MGREIAGAKLKFWGTLSLSVAICTVLASVAAQSAVAETRGVTPAGASTPVLRISGVPAVSLHAQFAQFAGHVTVGPETGIVPPLDRKAGPSAWQTSAAPDPDNCLEPNCDVTYNNGPVQHSPKVYVVFWGPTWQTNAGEEASANYLLSFYQGLGTNSDNWSRITSQYGDGTGAPAFTGSVFVASYVDTSAPPAEVTEDDVAAEGEAAASHFGITDLADDQVVVASQSGTCFSDGFAGSSCQPVAAKYCAWHAATADGSTGLSFTNLPYQLDAGGQCGEDFINAGGTWDGFSMVGGHEYAESVTDPQPETGWIDTADTLSGGEVADKCAWAGAGWGGGDPDGDITLPTGAFAVQSLWSNATGSCQMSAAASPAATLVTTSLSGGGKTGRSISVQAGTEVTDTAKLSGPNAATASGTVTYDVYSNAACTTLVSGATARPVGANGTMPTSAAVTATKAGTYYWKASYSGDAKNAASAGTCGASGEVETVTAPPPVPPSVDSVTAGLGKTSKTVSVSDSARGDLLVAYVAGKGPSGKAQIATVSASGLKWTLAARSDAGRGDAEVWSARASGKLSKLKVTVTEKYHGHPVDITVVAYKNAAGIGGHAVAHSAKGTPTASLKTTRANSWVFAVGDDWVKALARTPGAGQVLVSHATDSAGDTYWVQATGKATPKAGTKVAITDTKPATDPYNLVLVAIL